MRNQKVNGHRADALRGRRQVKAPKIHVRDSGLLLEEKLDADAWERLTLDVAASHLERDEATVRLRKLLRKKS